MAEPDAISMLKADHRKVKALLEELEKTTERGTKKREKLLARIDMELVVHTSLEETIFYPAFRDAVSKKEDREMYFEALEEHHVVKLVLPEIKRTDPSSEQFGAKAQVLKELVMHHAREEERELFPEARKVLDQAELEELGTRMQARRKELLARRSPKE